MNSRPDRARPRPRPRRPNILASFGRLVRDIRDTRHRLKRHFCATIERKLGRMEMKVRQLKRRLEVEEDDDQEPPTTRRRRRRPHPSSSSSSARRIRRNFLCLSPGCRKRFPTDQALVRHERIHLNVKPYACVWSDGGGGGCRYRSNQYSNALKHVRTQHFGLPETVHEQRRRRTMLNDPRDAREFVRVDRELARRRITV